MIIKLLVDVVYNILVTVAVFLSLPFWFFVYGSKGLKQRLFGLGSVNVGDRKSLVCWVNAVSVGEVQAAYPLILELKRLNPDIKIFLSTTTTSGMEFARGLLSDVTEDIFYAPFDVLWSVKRTVNSLKPDIYVTVEADVWPNILTVLGKKGVKVYIVNGRFSERAFKKAFVLRKLWSFYLIYVDKFLMRTKEDAKRLVQFGVLPKKVVVIGDTKIDAVFMRKQTVDVESLRRSLFLPKDISVIIAGSTHRGEEEVFLNCYKMLKGDYPSLRAIVVPRHPERAKEVGALLDKFSIKKWCFLSEVKGDWDVLVCDRIGVLFGLYGVSDVAFVGGSLVPCGGQNPIEPVVWGIPVCFGPYMDDFKEVVDLFLEKGVATIVENVNQMYMFIKNALENKVVSSSVKEMSLLMKGASKIAAREILLNAGQVKER